MLGSVRLWLRAVTFGLILPKYKCLSNSIPVVLLLKYIFLVLFFYLSKILRQYFSFYLSKIFRQYFYFYLSKNFSQYFDFHLSKNLAITFYFYLSKHFEYFAEHCITGDELACYDTLKISGGSSKEFCGTVTPQPFTPGLNVATLKMTSDGSVEQTGFDLSFTTVQSK